MHINQSSSSIKTTLFWSLIALTAFFICLQISFLMLKVLGAVELNYMMTKLTHQLPTKTFLDISYYIFWYLLLCFLLTIVVWLIAIANSQLLHLSEQRTFYWGIALWIITFTTTFLANQYYFPNSAYADFCRTLLPDRWLAPVLITMIFILLAALSLATLQIIAWMHQRISIKQGSVVLSCIIISIAAHAYFQHQQTTPLTIPNQRQPNIILIGIDSLRLNDLTAFGATKTQAPYIDAFIKQTTLFKNAWTPLAHTYPAWISILTGQYPKQHGARYDLQDPRDVNNQHSLATILQRQGYETIYASDETRFSNLDKRFGFDHVIGPPMSVNNFLLGSFVDLPLANLLMPSWIGKTLFPYNYANRAANITYHPQQFLTLLNPLLQQPRHKPLFLAVHLCLTHWPYVWSSTAIDIFPPETTEQIEKMYQRSLQGLDQQFNQLLEQLQQQRLLENSIVIVLSDHGEALQLPGDRITNITHYQGNNLANSRFAQRVKTKFMPANLETTAGHGNDVLSLNQYRVLLAWRRFGAPPYPRQTIQAPVSLLDIKPTLLCLSSFHCPEGLGWGDKNLTPYLQQNDPAPNSSAKNRTLFLETGYWPTFSREVRTTTGGPSIQQLIKNSEINYRIDPNSLRITVRDEAAKALLIKKQHAILKGDWLLALYPDDNRPFIPVLVNLQTQEWTDDLNSTFAINSPAQQLLTELKAFYGNEIR